jgi:hypothetical protein
MIGIIGAFVFYPICALMRSGYGAYKIPIWTSGVRLFPEVSLCLVFVALIARASKVPNTRFRLFPDDLPALFYLLSGVYGFVLCAAYLPLLGPLNGWWVSITPVVFYFAIRFMRPDDAQMERFLRFLLISFTMLALGSFYQYIFRPEWLIQISNSERPYLPAQTAFPPDIYWRVYMRMESLLLEENVWGTLCAFITLYCLAGLRGWKTPWTQWGVLGLSLAGMAFSMSRGSFVTCTIGVCVLLLLRGRHRGRILAALAALAVVGGWVMSQWGSVAGSPMANIALRVSSLEDSDSKKNVASDRSFQWVKGWDIFVRNPSGTGLGTVGYAAHLSGIGTHTVADGIYFRILAETGVPGAILTVCALVGTGWVLFRWIFDFACSQPTRRLGLTLFAFHCGFVIQSIGANTYDFWYIPSLFWTLFGIFVTKCERERLADIAARTAALESRN